jgi:phosphoglycerol transferase MdoB-like AlkP superfamily enzyme
MEDPAMRELKITPNLSEFGQGALYFQNIVNANTPTLQGQIATLASSLHLFRTTMNLKRWGGHEDVDEQDSDREGSLMTRYPFTSLLLKQHGYESVHVQGGDSRFADTGYYFRFSASYDDFISVATDKYSDQREYELGHWGASDIDTFNAATRWLKSRRGGPFFMSIATMDIHHPYYPVAQKPGVDSDLLNCVYSTDAGFGVLWDYFRTSRYKDNTIVIVTSDHALFPTAEYLGVRGEDIGYYDKIPLMIYSPFHASLMGGVDDVRGSQLDIAPTLFELLGLDSHNSFIGLSLLSDRREYPYIFGKVNLESRMSQVGEFSWSNDEQTRLVKYIRYLASINKLFPQTNR